MMHDKNATWIGVFPAVTTQFDSDLKVDLVATCRRQSELLQAGVKGIVIGGTVGEATSLSSQEKLDILQASVAANRSAFVIAGVCEAQTTSAAHFAREAERCGARALMVMPPLMYPATPFELASHLRTIVTATSLPIMLYNNPIVYRSILELDVIAELSNEPNVVCIKESSSETKRFTDYYNEFGERFSYLTGADEIALDGLLLGACGWVSGMTNLFPLEAIAMFEAARSGNIERALEIYRWFMPLLHLDAEADLVQAIKLGEQVLGLGNERSRPPRLPLQGPRRAAVIETVEKAARTRPSL